MQLTKEIFALDHKQKQVRILQCTTRLETCSRTLKNKSSSWKNFHTVFSVEAGTEATQSLERRGRVFHKYVYNLTATLLEGCCYEFTALRGQQVIGNEFIQPKFSWSINGFMFLGKQFGARTPQLYQNLRGKTYLPRDTRPTRRYFYFWQDFEQSFHYNPTVWQTRLSRITYGLNRVITSSLLYTA